MLVSHAWLSDLVDTGLSPDQTAHALTMAGLEVEGVEHTGPTFDGVVVGRVLEVQPHPNADRLRVCQVETGGPGPVQIVCGAPNVAAGQTVAVATVGTVLQLPDRETGALGPVTIKKGKIRGETSEGMICAEDELGLGPDHDGILVLGTDDADAPGEPFADWLARHGRRPGDAVLDVNLTPNRPDATGHLGVARDLAALTGAPLREMPVAEIAPGDAPVRVSVEDAAACPRFSAVEIADVRVGPSPDWMQARLAAVGLRPISNVVDVTNYVMLETGQPLHAYDADRVAAGPDGRPALAVRWSAPGETLRTLDGTDRALPARTLVVADATGALGVAGVMGGASSEVTQGTTRIVLEAAHWEPGTVRRTARALGLSTDASYRFERGADPLGTVRALARASHLIAETAGGALAPGLADVGAAPVRRTTTLRTARVARVLGAEVPEADARRLLEAIGFGLAETAPGTFEVTVPSWRPDVSREIDVIEEIARLWGLDRLPAVRAVPVALAPVAEPPEAALVARARDFLAAHGFADLATNSLLPAETAARYADPAWTGAEQAVVETLNPVSQEMAALRPSLVPGLVQAAAYNAARGAAALRLSDAGTVYGRALPGEAVPVAGYHERPRLALAMHGAAEAAAWDRAARAADVFDLKGIVLALLAHLGVPTPDETPVPEASPVAAYRLELHVSGRRIGVLGRLAEGLEAAADLRGPLFVAELDVAALAASVPAGPVRYAPISRHPAVERDIAVVVDAAQAVGPLLGTIRAAGGPLLAGVRLFDRYRGERVGAGRQSLAFGLRFAADRTLRDAEVDGRVRKIVGALAEAHGAELRQ